jgi:hypothetical protein
MLSASEALAGLQEGNLRFSARVRGADDISGYPNWR